MIGRIDATHINRFLDEHAPRYPDSEYFICGPGNMIETVSKALEERAVPSKSINKELFTPADSKSKTTSAAASDGTKRIKVHLDGEDIELIGEPGKTILDLLIDKKYEPPYSCRSGSCSTCIAKVTKGKVEMDACFALDDDEIEDGFVLTCQSHPTTDEVHLTYEV